MPAELPSARTSGRTPPKIAVFASLASYRATVIHRLMSHYGPGLHVIAGDRAPLPGIALMDSSDPAFFSVRNRYGPSDVLVQRLPWRRVLAAPVLLLDLNPRIPHVWALLLLRRIAARRTVLWGHAWPRRGRAARSSRIRLLMANLASGIVTYTETEGRELRPHLRSGVDVHAAPNALLERSACRFESGRVRRHVICVGRLSAEKRPDLLVAAFALAHSLQPDLRLTLIGGGPLRRSLEEQVAGLGLTSAVRVLGHLTDTGLLRAEYAKAFVSVSPGYVGLSATQSFGFGVPMLVADDEPHAPEVEALQPGVNGDFFTARDAEVLAHALLRAYGQRGGLEVRGPRIAASCARDYSVERMVAGLVAALGEAE